jgi:hypothetical protein
LIVVLQKEILAPSLVCIPETTSLDEVFGTQNQQEKTNDKTNIYSDSDYTSAHALHAWLRGVASRRGAEQGEGQCHEAHQLNQLLGWSVAAGVSAPAAQHHHLAHKDSARRATPHAQSPYH